MNLRKSIIGHIKTVTVHKYYVFIAMKECGYPIRGLFHDLSKFSPTEFGESIKYYTGTSSPIDGAKKYLGYSNAWLHHKGRNKHHSQYWIDLSFGEVKPIKMPWKYLVELICDTIGAGKAYMKENWTQSAPLDWWNLKDYKSFYHEDTRSAIIFIYRYINKYGWTKTAKLIKNGKLETIYKIDSFDDFIIK